MSETLDSVGVRFSRSSGLLLHPTSLPNGKLDGEVFRFLDWLAEAGQKWWQILPLAPPDQFGSPYAGLSAFACNTALLPGRLGRVSLGDFEQFVAANSYWVGGWSRWRGAGAIQEQVRFQQHWTRIREHARANEIRILGDIPFYVSQGSCDHMDHPELFKADQVAGVPPDDWSATGQLWNNPIYNWPMMRYQGYRWWVERLRRALQMVDAVRIDHFRGFVAYWSVPLGAATAQNGHWHRGPGIELFRSISNDLGHLLPLIAENLGLITPPVERLRRQLGFPGTQVMQFLFSPSMLNIPIHSTCANNVVYTGTHDNDTALGWWNSSLSRDRNAVDRALERCGIWEDEPNWKLIRLAHQHPADLSIIPAQDVLGLGSAARMNRPGRPRGNWLWRMDKGALTSNLAKRLRDSTLSGNR